MNKLVLTLVLSVFFSTLHAQSVLGKWKTIDDRTGEAKSVVEIYEQNGKIFGKIRQILDKSQETSVCDKCKGRNKNKPVLGMIIIKNLTKHGATYSGGTILDPENGKEYRCKIWIDEHNANTLKVRGYIAFLFRTQNWFRISEP